MRILCREGYAAATILLVSYTTSGQRVSNDDPGIQYRGRWVHTTFIDDDLTPEALVGSNVPGSTATYSFRGTGISVFGAFPVVGIFSIHSTYSIDGGAPTELQPPNTIITPAFHQKFFEVDALSDDEEHTLVITNAGQDYWLDYLAVTTTQSAPSPTTTTRSATQSTSSTTTTTAESTTSSKANPPSLSTAQPIPPITDSASTASAAGRQTTATQSVPDPSSQGAQSFSNTENTALTSTDAADANSTSSALTSSTASPTDTSARTRSTKFPVGAIAGLAVAGFLAFIVVGLVGCRWSRRKRSRRRKQDSLTSHDQGLTTAAFKPSEKRGLAHDDNSGGSAVDIRVSKSTSEREGPGEISTTNSDGMNIPYDRRTVFEPPGSPSSALPPILRQSQRKSLQNGSPVAEREEPSPYVVACEERRSIDGGVRLAGGPPDDVRAIDDQEDVRRGVSTLPPAYGVYPAA